MHISWKKITNGLLIIIIIALTVFFLFERYKLGLIRYFDIDEYAHLHWGYSFFIGEKPYTNFFYIFPPFFLYTLKIIYLIFGRSIEAIIQARQLMFYFFCGSSLTIFLIIRKLRNTKTALLALLVLVFLPLPADKMIEVRPDNPSTFFSLLGLYFFLKALAEGRKYYFISGASYAISLVFVPKTIFFIIAPLIFMFMRMIKGRFLLMKEFSRLLLFCLGIFPVLAILVFIIFSFGNPLLGFRSMSSMSANIARTLGEKFYLMPNTFFYSSDVYYGVPGMSLPYYVNLGIYLLSSIYALFKLMEIIGRGDMKKNPELPVILTFIIGLVSFIKFYPLKHAQYLIPITPFVSFYFADLVLLLKEKFRKVGLLLFVAIIGLIAVSGKDMYEAKLKWGNTSTLTNIKRILAAVPSSEKIYDLTGETIFYPNGYYFCCLPYGQYQEVLNFPKPLIAKDMEMRNTKYVYIGWRDRMSVIPFEDQKYISENFKDFFEDGSLLIRK